MREVNPAYSQAMLCQHQQSISGNARVGAAVAGDIAVDQSGQRGELSFGSGGQLGDISIGDVAGCDIIKTSDISGSGLNTRPITRQCCSQYS